MPCLPRPVPAAPKARPKHRHWVFAASSMICIKDASPGPSGVRPSLGRNSHDPVKEGRAVFHARLARRWRIVDNAYVQGEPMSASATIQSIYRYPVKGLSPESLDGVRLEVGQTLPADRMYAIENGPSGFDPAAPIYLAKTYFLMLMKNERLALLDTLYDEDTHVLTIH